MSGVDVQARIVRGLMLAMPGVTIQRLVPDDLSAPAVVVQQNRAGVFDGVTSTAFLDVKAYAPTRDGAVSLSLEARGAMLGQAARALPDGTGLVDSVAVDSEPVELFYSEDVTLVSGVYRVAVRDV